MCGHFFLLLPAVGGAQAFVLTDGNAYDFRRLWELALHALEDVARQVLTGWDELAVRELGDIEIDVAVVEARLHLLAQDAVENSEVDYKSGRVVDWPADGHIAHIGVTVVVRPRTRAESADVLIIAPVGSAVPMSGR